MDTRSFGIIVGRVSAIYWLFVALAFFLYYVPAGVHWANFFWLMPYTWTITLILFSPCVQCLTEQKLILSLWFGFLFFCATVFSFLLLGIQKNPA